MCSQLTDDLVEASFPGVGSVESLRAALIDSTAAQREEDQKEAVHEALILAVADRVDADIPESAIRQLAENEYQAKLHEIQLKVRCTSTTMRSISLHPTRTVNVCQYVHVGCMRCSSMNFVSNKRPV